MDAQFDFTGDPLFFTPKIKAMLKAVILQARSEVAKVTEPGAQALFETTADVLGGLVKAYEHYERSSEAA